MTLLSRRFTFLRVAGGLSYWLLVGVLLSLLSAPFGPLTMAQEGKPTERVYNHSQVDVEKALEDLRAYETARLPVLAGFVNARANTLKDYGNPHYQFQIEVIGQGSQQTLVQVSAKITAWYSPADPTHFQYALIPSNGRLEEELLDRLSVYLEEGSNERSSEPLPTPRAPPVAASSNSGGSVDPAGSPASPAVSPPAGVTAGAMVSPSGQGSSDPGNLASQIATVQSELQTVQQKERQSQQQIAEFESVARSRQHITDLAIAKRAQTPVFEEPSALSKILFRADAEDEFAVTEARQGWVGVRLEGAGKAWLRISDLEQPGDSDVSEDLGVNNFSTANEVIQAFTGDWPVLKGKSALFVLAQPRGTISTDILGKSQLDFASHTFLEGYRAAIHSQQTIAGVVVVFAGDKPGVAAATLPEIRQWQEGRIADKLFLARCSFDPPDSFRDIPKH